jgi:hypothetical protein
MKIVFAQVRKEYRATLLYVKCELAEPFEADPAPEG